MHYRLQKAEAEWQAKWDEVEKKHGESVSSLEKERVDLKESLAQTESSLAQASSQLSAMETEAEGHRNRTSALEEAVGKLQVKESEYPGHSSANAFIQIKLTSL